MKRQMNYWLASLLVMLLSVSVSARAALDHTHAQWDALLQRHVVEIENGHASRVDYTGFKKDQAALDDYLRELSAVSMAEYDSFSKEQKMAFLINAYNAFTIKLILIKYPDLKSIRDLGNLLNSPWKKSFFTLLGAERYLDWIEHEMLRKEGVFDEPRIHFAVNCASIGCPKLLKQAFQASRLDQQLEQAKVSFLQDRKRNYYDAASNTVYMSKIFDWFEEDFERKYGSLDAFVKHHANDLGLPAAADFKLKFTDYDWNLNDIAATQTQPDRSGGTR